jgi:hypothetical protein
LKAAKKELNELMRLDDDITGTDLLKNIKDKDNQGKSRQREELKR